MRGFLNVSFRLIERKKLYIYLHQLFIIDFLFCSGKLESHNHLGVFAGIAFIKINQNIEFWWAELTDASVKDSSAQKAGIMTLLNLKFVDM